LAPPALDVRSIPPVRPGVSVRARHGAIAFSLVPVHLEQAGAAAAAAAV
jgi:hypothetical protein